MCIIVLCLQSTVLWPWPLQAPALLSVSNVTQGNGMTQDCEVQFYVKCNKLIWSWQTLLTLHQVVSTFSGSEFVTTAITKWLMGQTAFWEANSHLAVRYITRHLWNMVPVQKRPLLAPTLNQMNPGSIITFYVYEIHFNIIHSSTPRSQKWSLPFRFANWNFVRIQIILYIISVTYNKASY
jgi:hypothetical protein